MEELMGYGSRMPTSNEGPRQTGGWSGANEFMDEFALLLSGDAKRCNKCKRTTHIRYLINDECPDCREDAVNQN